MRVGLLLLSCTESAEQSPTAVNAQFEAGDLFGFDRAAAQFSILFNFSTINRNKQPGGTLKFEERKANFFSLPV